MTDKYKQLSIADLDLPPKRGRPKSGNALSNSQKQKLYRQRVKERGARAVLLEPFEVALLDTLVLRHVATLEPDDGMLETYKAIWSKLGASL